MASEHQRAERLLRDREAHSYESWYRRTKGIGFDFREISAVTSQVRGRAGVALDVGGGTGRVTRALAASGRMGVVTVDLSGSSLQEARRRGASSAIQASAAEGLPLRSSAFEVVIACQVLQHLDDVELAAALGELRRVARPGGALLVAGYNGAARRYAAREEERYDNGLRVFRRRPDTMASAAARAGFSLREQSFYGLVPLHRLPSVVGVNLDRLACAIRSGAEARAGYIVQRYEAG